MSTPATSAQAPLQQRNRAVRTPGPSAVRMGWQLLTRRNLLSVLETYDVYGDVARWRFAGRTYFSLRSPEHLKHVLISNQDNYVKSFQYRLLAVLMGDGLLTNEGESWTRQRTLIQPMFAKRHLGQFAEHMTAAIADFADRWDEHPDGNQLNVAREMNGLTLDVVGRALFGAGLADTAARLGPAVLVGLRTGVAAARLQLVVGVPRWAVDRLGRQVLRGRVLPPGVRRIQNALQTVDEVVYGLIDAREASLEEDPGDLLGLLLSARDEQGERMSRKQVHDELVTFLLAGHETTANGLAWMWYLLSQNPDARQRLVAEVDEVLGGRRPNAEDADRLTWTAACFQEAMRIYPPVWLFEREAVGEDHVDGHRIPPRATVFTYLVHRNPQLWPDPERFDPHRFLGEAARQHPRCAYMPFGAGRRICVGAGFAIMEATLITAMIAQRFRLDLVPGARVVPETTVTLRPRHGLPMTLHHR